MPEVWSAPVRFVECDQQGVVFNAHYLTWADEAATDEAHVSPPAGGVAVSDPEVAP